MDTLRYLHLQMGLEGIGLVGEHAIRQVKVVPGEELPLVLLARLADRKFVGYYSESLPPGLLAELAACISSIEFPVISPIVDVLASHDLHVDTGHYKTYLFPPQAARDPDVIRLSKDDPRVQAFGFDSFAEQLYAIEQNGKITSACVSVREDQYCGEAWVYTDPCYRRGGLAKKVVSAWAEDLGRIGKVPFYSHEVGNTSSESLARALQLQPVFEEIAITKR